MVAASVGLWALLVAVAWRVALPDRLEWKLSAAPIGGMFDRDLSSGVVRAALVGAVLVAVLPRFAARAPWAPMLLGAVVLTVVWGTFLAGSRGPDRIEQGLDHPHDYPAAIPMVDAVGVRTFVATFDEEATLSTYPVHVQGHPVGATLAFVGLDRIGLGGPLARAVVVDVVGATAVAAVAIAVREVAGERAARWAVPFLVLAPSAVWMFTSGDALFTAVAAWSVAALVLATRADASPRAAGALALLGGVLAGVGAMLSYGLVLVGLVAVAVVVRRRAWRLVPWAVVGGASVLGTAALAGFWWFSGLQATHARYLHGVSSVRSGTYFALLGNPAAFALACGPAVAIAIALVRDRRLWLLGGAGLAAVALADLSGLSKAEVERIWLPFVPWTLVLAAGLPQIDARGAGANGRAATRWSWVGHLALALGVFTAVAIEATVLTPW